MPIGCTGWLVNGGEFLTAGHCIGAGTQTVEFNVPASQANGTTVAPAVRDQYPVIAGSIVSANTGVGNDWAIFRVPPNTETGLMPTAAQGGAFQLSNTARSRNRADHRLRRRRSGAAPTQPDPADPCRRPQHNDGGANSATLRYTADTEGGNSGSPVIVEGGGNVAVGIHTNGGCTATGGSNAGTSFRNQGLWTRSRGTPSRTEDIVWQHHTGQVHYWPIQAGQRQGGIDIASPGRPRLDAGRRRRRQR